MDSWALHSFALGGLVHSRADWRGSSLISSSSKLLISQVEEIELWAAPVWPRWAWTQGRRSIPTGAATGLFVLLCLLTGEIGGAYRRGLTLRCAHQGYTVVCVNDIYMSTYTHSQKCVCTHISALPLSHIQTMCVFSLGFTSHFRSLINTQIHLHTQTHIRNKSISSSDFWSDVEGWPLRRCIKARYIFLSTRLQGWESQVSVVLGYHTQHAGMLCPFSSKENINNYKSITYCSLLFAV